METTPLIILFFSLCALATALLLIVIYLVKTKKIVPPGEGARRAMALLLNKREVIDSAELRTVLDSITDYICIIDDRFRIRYANKSYLELTGQADCVGRSACHEAFWKRTAVCDECPAKETFEKGVAVQRKKMVLRLGHDEKKHLEISTYPLLDEKRRVVSVIEYIRDMTKENTMLAELIRAEKLAGIGVMTTGIAHEMNNALSGISGTASNLLTMPEKYGLNEKGVNRVFSILDSSTRATAVMKNLLQFSNPLQEETRIMINVRQLLKRIVTTAYIQEAPDIDRRLQFDDGLAPISGDFSKIELVFMNIISNAIRSIQQKKAQSKAASQPYKGVLTVAARNADESVLVTFTDNGVGIAESVQPKIFEPFFSTWPGGNKTGLGLSTAMHIVEEHFGRISFESSGDTTTFSVRLPVNANRSPMSRS